MDVREAIRTQKMKPYQIAVIALCLIVTIIDGFEILVMAFVAPFLSKAWSVNATDTGLMLSASVFGSALGAIFVSPLADRMGRRKHTLISLALITVGMTASIFVTGVGQMVAVRAFTGLFIGGIVASMNILVAEYCSDAKRGVAMGIYGIGFPLGASIGGFISVALMRGAADPATAWRLPFVMGAIITAVMFVVALFLLPESVGYLVEKRPAGALAAYNKIAVKLGYPTSTELPAKKVVGQLEKVGSALFAGVMRTRTIWLWVGYACLMGAFYFANTWTAKLVADQTKDAALGSQIQSFVPLGGVIGALVFAALATKLRPRMVTMLILFFGTLIYVVYGNAFTNTSLAPLLALGVGLAANGGVAAFYAISPSIYPTSVRATGVGWMIGFGRSVAILAPYLVGWVIESFKVSPQTIYQFFGIILAIGGVAIFMLDRTYANRSENPDTPHLTLREEEEALVAAQDAEVTA